MRIAFVLFGDLSLTSGGFLYDRTLIERLRARGHEVDVVSLPWPSYAASLALNARRVPYPRPIAAYDVVLQDELAHPALIVENRRLRAARVPVVGLVHNLTYRQPSTRHTLAKRALERTYLATLDAAVSVCRDTERDVKQGLREGALTCVAYAGRDHVAPAIDARLVAARAHETGPLRVLLLASVMRHKGLHRLISACELSHADVVIHAVGSLTADARYVAAQRARMHDGSRLVLHGELHGAALDAQLRQAQVLALPSDREAYPLAALEGLGYGHALLLTHQGGTRELVARSAAARLFDPDDTAAWAHALSQLARDRELLSSMGRAALERFHTHPPWDDTARTVEELCARLRERRPAQHPENPAF